MMKLILPSNEYITEDFICWLIIQIKYIILNNINESKLDLFNNYFKEQKFFKPINNKQKFDVRKLILLSINNITYRKLNNVYIIEIKNNVTFPGYTVNINTLCRLLNYGNVNIKGYPLYTDSFKTIKANLKTFYGKYVEETF